MRTTDEIQAEMTALQAKQPALATLNSTSSMSVFAALKALWVLLVQALEQRMDTLTTDLTNLTQTAQIGGIAWYVMMVKAFQYGDSVQVYDGIGTAYPTPDPTKQIVTQASVTEVNGRLLVKVAKMANSALTALTTDELSSLREYVRQIKYAGVSVDVISLNADQLQIDVTIQYDRQVLNAQGQLLTNPATVVVFDAITAYLRALPFDGVLYLSALTQAVKAVPGVIDCAINTASSALAGQTAFTAFTRSLSPKAGHMYLTTTSTFTYV